MSTIVSMERVGTMGIARMALIPSLAAAMKVTKVKHAKRTFALVSQDRAPNRKKYI